MAVTFATERLRCLKRPSGISGAATRASRARKIPKRTIAAPSRPSVSAEVQPLLFPFTIA
jgi:hypothetical protein